MISRCGFSSTVVVVSVMTSLGWSASALADVKLPQIFADHMVIQQQTKVPIWGWADAGEKVSVAIGDQTKEAMADKNGDWTVRLDEMHAGGPLALTVTAGNTITLKDVLVGEVWLCSGQSNMAMQVQRAKDFDQERQQASYPNIRMFSVDRSASPQPQTDCQGQWTVCTSESVGNFSATAYFFGRQLHQQLDVPVGLINSSWGGTDIAAWTALPAQRAVSAIAPKLDAYDELIANYDPEKIAKKHELALKDWKNQAEKAKQAGRTAPRRPRPPADPRVNQNRPANLFNGMIQPLVPYALRGAIWYQGERNSRSVSDGILYATQLQTMINDWRERWAQDDFSFITVQLPNFHAPQQETVETTGWVMVREGQLRSLKLPNTGIAITTDIGEVGDIHPKNKQDVGNRLALWELGTTYEQDLIYSGPIFSSCQYRSGRTNAKGRSLPGSITIAFLHVGEALKTRDGGPLKGFAVAGQDRKFYQADARIKEDGTVDLSSKNVAEPIAARYGWADNPSGNLVNSAGLPASPFRTDSWDVSQEP